jgi:tight adherence protein B
MELNPELLVYGAIFVAVLALVEGIYLTVFGRSIRLDRKVNRRLEMLEKGARREEVLEQLRKEMNQHVRARRVPVYALLSDKAQKGGIAFTPAQLVIVMAVVSLLVWGGLTLGTQTGPAIRLVLAPAIGVGGIYFWVASKARKRMALIEEQLPDAVELMVRSLKVGHPFSAAIAIVAREVADPLGSEMGMIADEAQYGRDVGDALKSMADRLDMQDLRFLAVAVSIQQQSGGNLAEILAGLAQVVRLRFKLFRRVAAITAEARFSGFFLSAFPLVALVAINLLDPTYFEEVKDHALFVPGALVVGGLLAVNLLVMKRMTTIRV